MPQALRFAEFRRGQTLRLAALFTVLALSLGYAQDPAESALADTVFPSAPLRQHWATNGFLPFATLTTEVWGNVDGGLKHGAWWNSLLDFGFELDTARAGWWQGGVFLVQAHWVQNLRNDLSFTDYTGTVNPISSSFAGDHVRVYNLHYRQAWDDEKFLLKLGQIAVDDDFMLSGYGALFINSAFGPMPSQVGTPLAGPREDAPAFPIYSVAAPGVFLRVRPGESFYSQLGLYYGRPGVDERDNHGFAWIDESPVELGLFWENGVDYRFAHRSAAVRVGLSYHSGHVNDFSGAETGDPPATRQSIPNFYLIHDWELVSDREGRPKLGLFARGGIVPEHNQSMVSVYADGGLNWFGPLPGREADIAGAAVSYTEFGSDYRRSTGPRGVAHNETALELTYQAHVVRGFTLQADLQFLFHPAVNPESGERETAIVLGLRAEVRF
jgi:porin